MSNISATQLRHCPSSKTKPHNQKCTHFLEPCKTHVATIPAKPSRGLGHNSPPECTKYGISILWNPTSIPAGTPFDGGVLTGSTQHRGQKHVSHRQNKGQGPGHMLEQPLVLSCNCSMAPLNSRWPEDTAASPTDTNPNPPYSLGLQGSRERTRPWLCRPLHQGGHNPTSNHQ